MAAIPIRIEDIERRLEPAGIGAVRPLAGGASSLTYAAKTSDGQRVVVKVAPAGLPPVLHRDVLRQARLLQALHPLGVPVPDVLFQDAGTPPEVPPLFVMSFVDGISHEPLFDLDDARDPEPVVADRFRSAARALAALHAVDPLLAGLAREPAVALAAEIDRWCRSLATVDPPLAPGWESAADALRRTQPAPMPPTVTHGDFRLGNLLVHDRAVTAIIDWELWGVGDPRVDLGWFLANGDPSTYQRPSRYSGAAPSRAELTAIYVDSLGHAVENVEWFQALACFKSAATWSLIVKHNRRRPTPEPDTESLAPVLPRLLERAHALIA